MLHTTSTGCITKKGIEIISLLEKWQLFCKWHNNGMHKSMGLHILTSIPLTLIYQLLQSALEIKEIQWTQHSAMVWEKMQWFDQIVSFLNPTLNINIKKVWMTVIFIK